MFNDTKLGGASRDSPAGEGAVAGAIAFHPSRYHVYGTQSQAGLAIGLVR